MWAVSPGTDVLGNKSCPYFSLFYYLIKLKELSFDNYLPDSRYYMFHKHHHNSSS